ncbi:MAG: hypothetical protein RL701_4131 [Pseudomonadota bacterium]
MKNTDYKAAGVRAGKVDALNLEHRGAARAWRDQVGHALLDSPGGRHLFEAAYELAFEAVITRKSWVQVCIASLKRELAQRAVFARLTVV